MPSLFFTFQENGEEEHVRMHKVLLDFFRNGEEKIIVPISNRRYAFYFLSIILLFMIISFILLSSVGLLMEVCIYKEVDFEKDKNIIIISAVASALMFYINWFLIILLRDMVRNYRAGFVVLASNQGVYLPVEGRFIGWDDIVSFRTFPRFGLVLNIVINIKGGGLYSNRSKKIRNCVLGGAISGASANALCDFLSKKYKKDNKGLDRTIINKYASRFNFKNIEKKFIYSIDGWFARLIYYLFWLISMFATVISIFSVSLFYYKNIVFHGFVSIFPSSYYSIIIILISPLLGLPTFLVIDMISFWNSGRGIVLGPDRVEIQPEDLAIEWTRIYRFDFLRTKTFKWISIGYLELSGDVGILKERNIFFGTISVDPDSFGADLWQRVHSIPERGEG